MPEENVEVVRKMAHAFNQGGWRRVIDEGLVAAQVEYHDDRRWPGARSSVGTSALEERFVEILEVLGEDGRVTVEELLDCDGDRVLMIFRFLGEARASGILTDYRWSFLCRVRDGQVDYMQAYLDNEEAFDAAGLSARR